MQKKLLLAILVGLIINVNMPVEGQLDCSSVIKCKMNGLTCLSMKDKIGVMDILNTLGKVRDPLQLYQPDLVRAVAVYADVTMMKATEEYSRSLHPKVQKEMSEAVRGLLLNNFLQQLSAGMTWQELSLHFEEIPRKVEEICDERNPLLH